MSNHQKRLSVPKSWPVERKTEKFTVKADAGPHGEAGVPLLIVLRDVLGYVDSRKEARFALNQGSVAINGDRVTDEERPVGMFDILAFEEREESYRVFPGDGGRLALTPIDADSAGSKLGKIVGKQHVPGGALQLTLHDGETLRVDDDAYDTGDSLIVDNETGEIVAHFVYEEGALVTAVNGAHSGEIGTVDEIQVTPGSSSNNVLVDQDGGSDASASTGGGEAADGFETVEEYVVVIDENFTDGDEDAADEESEADDESADEDADADEADEDESADADDGGDDE